jgi:hypothetical protein
MCLGGAGAGQAAKAEQRARQEAADRENRIKEGQTKIDAAFSQYNQPYYDSYAKSITDVQRPQLDDQYGDARGQLTAALADRGMLESTVGAQEFGKFGKIYADKAAEIAAGARDAAFGLRGKVEGQKSDLYALNRASADPQGISTQAIGSATALAAPGAASPIGEVFTGALNPWLAYQYAKQNSPGPAYKSSTGSTASGAGSGRVVR